MKQTIKQQGFGILGVLLIVVVLTGIGGAGWYVWQHQKDTTQKTDTRKITLPTTNENADKKPSTPSSYTAFNSVFTGSSMAFPTSWGDVTTISDNLEGTPSLDNVSFQKSLLQGRFSISTTAASDFTISVQKYGAVVKPEAQNGTYVWHVTTANPADTTDKSGNTYQAKSFKNTNGVTIYDFEWSDEGSTHARWVFANKDKFVTVSLPTIWTKSPDGNGNTETPQADLDAYHTLAKTIADTIHIQ